MGYLLFGILWALGACTGAYFWVSGIIKKLSGDQSFFESITGDNLWFALILLVLVLLGFVWTIDAIRKLHKNHVIKKEGVLTFGTVITRYSSIGIDGNAPIPLARVLVATNTGETEIFSNQSGSVVNACSVGDFVRVKYYPGWVSLIEKVRRENVSANILFFLKAHLKSTASDEPSVDTTAIVEYPCSKRKPARTIIINGVEYSLEEAEKMR